MRIKHLGPCHSERFILVFSTNENYRNIRRDALRFRKENVSL
jgi:hypothetical protein